MNKVIQSAKGILRSKKAGIFALVLILLVIVLLILSSWPEPVGNYKLDEIPAQGNVYYFNSLNDKGQAVGFMPDPQGQKAIIWDINTGLKILKVPAGYSSARDINNSGQVCGHIWDPNNKTRACFWDSDGKMYDIGTLGKPLSFAEAINEKGQVVGFAHAPECAHAFLWTKEKGIIDIDTRGTLTSRAIGINNEGQVVGNLYTADGKRHVFLWREETGMVDIHDRLRGIESIAMGITNSGLIYGEYFTANNLIHTFVWDKDRGFRDLKITSEEDHFIPFVIADSGKGIIKTRQERLKKFGYVFKEENNLSLLLDPKLKKRSLYRALPFETNSFIAYDINNSGQIIAVAAEKGTLRWYLMTPTESDD